MLALAIVVGIGSAALAQSAARWYDAYADGVQAVERGNWAAAEPLLQQAKAGGPAPGRRVFTYGDTYIRFLPDYYLGIVYLNTGRAEQAVQAFATVRAQGLVTVGDPEYAALERHGRQATFTAAFDDAVALTAAGQFADAATRLEAARTTGLEPAKVADLSSQIEQGLTPATQQDEQVPPVTAQGTGPSYLPSGQGVTLSAPPSVARPTPAPTIPSNAGGQAGTSPYNPSGPVGGTPLPTAVARQGILAYFSGDYRSAVTLLQQAAGPDGAAPVNARDVFYFACARVALVLGGGADIALLREARLAYQGLGSSGVPAADRRYISPRVLAELESP